jgi:transglutaminase-like putative cysteine protease
MGIKAEDFEVYLRPTRFIDCDHRSVADFAKESAGSGNDRERAVRLFYAVRDKIKYDPYRIDLTEEKFKASVVLKNRYGYCVAKALLLAAAVRAVGIPCRLCFADVRNHLIPARLKEAMKTDIFTWHGYTEIFLDGRWVKATPAFNIAMCRKLDIVPVEFDGIHDATFSPFDRKGNRHMEYVCDYGFFADLPFGLILASFKQHYPDFFTKEKDTFLAALAKKPHKDPVSESEAESS